MAHVRTQIRDWLKTSLAGSADAGSRVLVRRTLPLAKEMQPTLTIAIDNERSADVSMDGSQERIEQVRVTAVVKGDAEDSEDVLDRLAVFIEGVFAGDPKLGGLADTYAYQGTEFSFGGEGEKTLCTAALTFALTLYTKRGDPQTAL